VYLNDGGPVIFKHVGGPAATRAATKAGAFRVYRGLDEVHEVENTSSVPSEFLRVELKTQGKEPASFRGKFMRPAAPTNEVTVQFDHPQVRISRIWVTPGQRLDIKTAGEPALVIALHTGQSQWLPANGSTVLSNSGASPIDFLQFDLKTPPVSPTERDR
jgi:hypothetical protein